METKEILNPPPAPAIAGNATENPMPLTPSAEASSAEVLITEQQVMFSTAAAGTSRPANRLVAAVGRVLATSMAESRSRRQQSVQRSMYYIERARMAREMERL